MKPLRSNPGIGDMMESFSDLLPVAKEDRRRVRTLIEKRPFTVTEVAGAEHEGERLLDGIRLVVDEEPVAVIAGEHGKSPDAEVFRAHYAFVPQAHRGKGYMQRLYELLLDDGFVLVSDHYSHSPPMRRVWLALAKEHFVFAKTPDGLVPLPKNADQDSPLLDHVLVAVAAKSEKAARRRIEEALRSDVLVEDRVRGFRVGEDFRPGTKRKSLRRNPEPRDDRVDERAARKKMGKTEGRFTVMLVDDVLYTTFVYPDGGAYRLHRRRDGKVQGYFHYPPKSWDVRTYLDDMSPFSSDEPRENPLLDKKKPLKRMTPEEREPYLDENVIGFEFGPAARLFGHHPTARIAYFVVDPEADLPYLEDVGHGRVLDKRKGRPLNLPIFHMVRAGLMGEGTIPAFWKNPVSKRLAGAIQFCTPAGKLVITHIATRAGWHRKGVASALLDKVIRDHGAGRKVYAHEMTDEGRAIFAMYSRRTGIPIKEIDIIPGVDEPEEEPRENPLLVTKFQRHIRFDNKVSFAAAMDPEVFLRLTTRDAAEADKIVAEAKPLEFYNQLSETRQILVAPLLRVDVDSGVVEAHEGRHRAAAVLKNGEDVMEVGITLCRDRSGNRRFSVEDCPPFIRGQFKNGVRIPSREAFLDIVEPYVQRSTEFP